MGKRQSADHFAAVSSDNDGLGELIVDVVAGILNGYSAALSPAGDYGDGLTAVTAQGEQKRIQLLIISFDPLNDILFTFLCSCQIHGYHSFPHMIIRVKTGD